ncbi:NmrA/HSCARG family protein [Actinoallomurus sp. CA-150999]|uniref:NmrA/HSCARG family protein n=1 Tax=Actinoallomurus sp. CA-150999 TaxID=3239887 RepID=UPI003D949F5B
MKRVLVTGATGNQGGAVVDALLADGRWDVRALVRHPERATSLVAKGVEVVAGDLDEPVSLTAPMRGVHGVFSVQGRGRREAAQGIALADAAAEAGVSHLVYSSVGGVDRVRGIPHFDSKWQIEQHLNTLDLPATILRPASYMEGFTMRGAAQIGLSMMAATLGRDRTLQMIAVRDIGIFAALAFADPDGYLGRALELAGDELTVPQIADATGKRYVTLPKTLLRLMGPEARMFFWFAESGYKADIPALRIRHPHLLDFRTWLTGQPPH